MYEFNDDNWVETAMVDDSIVATFLLTLNKKTSSPDSSSSSTLYPPFNVHWTVRQRRSKLRSHTAKIKTESRRASPTTPLSWSAATSGSGAAAATTDGNEESSRFNKSVHTSRSKVRFRFRFCFHFFNSGLIFPGSGFFFLIFSSGFYLLLLRFFCVVNACLV
jgi:hypothetical protein